MVFGSVALAVPQPSRLPSQAWSGKLLDIAKKTTRLPECKQMVTLVAFLIQLRAMARQASEGTNVRAVNKSVFLSGFFLLVFGQPILADQDQYKEFDDHVVFFNALTTDLLSPEVARAYQIVRSNRRVLLNVVALRKEPGTPGIPVVADIQVKVTNLTGQLKELQLRRVGEDESIYYIGDLPFANAEVLIFELAVTPEGWSKPLETIRFQRQFFTK